MAGLLTFPQSALPSPPYSRPVTFSKQTPCLRGLQLQVQFRTLTGFPCIAVAKSHPITINCAAKVLLFSPTTNHSAKIFQNKKEKGTDIHRKIRENEVFSENFATFALKSKGCYYEKDDICSRSIICGRFITSTIALEGFRQQSEKR